MIDWRREMKNWVYFVFGFVIILILIILRFSLDKQGEDSWIQDERGIWIKHGNPSSHPDEVYQQGRAIACAFFIYNNEKVNGTIFDSQCLGTCDLGGGYAVDIVHSPREDVDNEIENQCESFRNGDVNKFIELDRDGKIVRIID